MTYGGKSTVTVTIRTIAIVVAEAAGTRLTLVIGTGVTCCCRNLIFREDRSAGWMVTARRTISIHESF